MEGFFCLFILYSLIHSNNAAIGNPITHPSITSATTFSPKRRESIEIIIGGGDSPPPTYPPEYNYPPPEQPDCPPPPPPSCPPPSSPPPPPPLSKDLANAIAVIQKFGTKIGCDPQDIVKTWTGNNICKDKTKYKGFICAKFTPGDNSTQIAGVNFNSFNFAGKGENNLCLDDIVNKFPKIVFFHANTNGFSGSVPQITTKNFPYYYELDLSNNKLVGSFPEIVLKATNLIFLDLRYNMFTGPLPSGVFLLDLDVLFLNNNQFTGCIPDTIGKNRALYLTLANNRFTGQIPRSIGQASNRLIEILLLNNQLSGCLPYEIGLLRKATVFDASENKLTGPIPQSFGCLTKIQFLNISYNCLSGAIPESICKLSNINSITLNNNFITQVGKECRKLIQKKMLDVSKNCILGIPGQRTAEECKAFFSTNRPCTDAWMQLNYVPCGGAGYSATEKDSDPQLRPFSAPLPSGVYAALHRPGLH